jgi:Protein of unknown function (DUF2877)
MVLNIVKSISIGSTAAERISKSGIIGRVQSIFDRSFFIITEDKKLIFIVKRDLSNGPINIMIELAPHKNISSIDIEVGNIVTRQNNRLLVGHSMEILLAGIKKWKPSQLLEVDDLTRLNQKINIVKMLATERGKHSGLGQLINYEREIMARDTIHDDSLNRIATKALPHLKQLMAGIFEKNLVILQKSTEGLIGLGLGLTPSADDTLCGIMAVLYILGENSLIDMNYVSAVNKAIISNVDEMRTTLVSKEFLEHAARGQVAENVSNVINVVLSPSEALLISKVEKLLSMGETSGTDITLGVILGLRIGLQLLVRDVPTALGKIKRSA